jgi:hypothetical protein
MTNHSLPGNFVPDHPDADVNERRRAMNLATTARQTRAGCHCPRCSALSRTEVLLALHILHDHLQPTRSASIEGSVP